MAIYIVKAGLLSGTAEIEIHTIHTLLFAFLLLLALTVSIPSVMATADPDIYIEDSDLEVNEVASGIEFPTSMAFLDENRILVLEKEGKVKEIRGNEVSSVPVLDIRDKVDDRFERGMLGIAISDQNNGTNDDEEVDSAKHIFLFYTERIPDSGSDKYFSDNFRNNSFAVNRLYQYKMEGDKLVEPKLIVEIPGSKSNSTSFIHVGGALVIGPDRRLYLTTGDGKACFDYEACQKIIKEGPLRAETANIRDGRKPTGMGGILRITMDNGELMNSKGILGDEHPLNLYYAYGIRNSFGLDFDPVTGNLWDTENGPAFGDEINLVEPGFNSGWAKIQGVWPIGNYNQLNPELERGFIVDNIKSEHADDLIDFDGKGKYSEPELTWNVTVGVTGIKFISSDQLGEEYENDILVGTFNEGILYRFDLDDDRKNIHLDGYLRDKVANNDAELQQAVFAGGFGAISDIEVGPDGHIYILSISYGKVYKILPKD